MSRETPERLKQAVEELLLTKGEVSTTLRDITDLAGANVAAVAYHFKSKDNLIAKVFAEAVDEVTELQSRRILSLPKDHSLEDLIEVWLHPLLSPAGPNDREAMLWRIIQRGAVEKAPGLLVNMNRADSPVETTLLPLLASHLNHLSKEELFFRHNAIIGGLAGLVSGAMGVSVPKETPKARPKEFIIAWIIGSLKGQASK
jgi:AcrR family transcriptional regulator